MVPPKGVYFPISKLHSISAVVNFLVHNNLGLCYYGQVNLLLNQNENSTEETKTSAQLKKTNQN